MRLRTPALRLRSLASLLMLANLVLSGCGRLPAAPVPSAAQSQLPAIIFDIDGTLTPDVYAIHTVRPHAVQAVDALAAKGYQIVYLSARNPWLQRGLPSWLHNNGFPAGVLHVPQTFSQHFKPTAFKTQILKNYRDSGWQLALAYGDSSTDFLAYAAAGIRPEARYALLREGAEQCQVGIWKQCLRGWEEHLDFIATLDTVRIPP